MNEPALAAHHDAPQHAPRPLPLFLEMLRSETAASPERRAAALRGLALYQAAAREDARPARPIAARCDRASLIDYGGTGTPVVFVPSLINPPFVLDLAEGNSLLAWLADRGHRILCVDWGSPRAEEATLDIAGHVERLLLPMLRTLPQPVILAGYCLGGTIALGAARAIGAAGVALIAAPWHFAGFPARARETTLDLWHQSRAVCAAMGVVPMEVLQSGFWSLDPARTIDKFVRFAAMDPASPQARAFVALEDWANGGAPLTFAAGQDLFEGFFGADRPGRGEWIVEGHAVDPAALACPLLDIVSTTDRIVPAATSAGAGERHLLELGHVGMVVGGRARAALWQPLGDWIGRVSGATGGKTTVP